MAEPIFSAVVAFCSVVGGGVIVFFVSLDWVVSLLLSPSVETFCCELVPDALGVTVEAEEASDCFVPVVAVGGVAVGVASTAALENGSCDVDCSDAFGVFELVDCGEPAPADFLDADAEGCCMVADREV